MAAPVAPVRNMVVAAEWRRRPAPLDGGSSTPARRKARSTMYEIEEDIVNGR
jgi:hypothetical protein